MRLFCLIPAWNEAARIGKVLELALHHPLIAGVLVIDDGSQDATAAIARAAGARVIASPGNLGKTRALALGLAELDPGCSHVLLLDADLTGLGDADLTRLIRPVMAGEAEASLSLRGNAPGLWRLIGLDYITGERVLPLSLLRPHLAALHTLPRFGFEVFLNTRLLAARTPIAVIDWPGVASPSKAAKRGGLWAGLWADAAMMRDIFRTVGAGMCLRQILGLRALRIPRRLEVAVDPA